METKLGDGVPFSLGDLVLCRYSTYPYWPATIDQTHEDGPWGSICCTRPTASGSLVLCLWCTFCNEDTGGWVRYDRIVRYHPALVDAIRVSKDHMYSKSQADALFVAEKAFNSMPKSMRQIEDVPRPPEDFFQARESSADDVILPGESESNKELTHIQVQKRKSAIKQVARRTFSGCPLSDDEADADFAILQPRRKIRKRTADTLRSNRPRAFSPSATEMQALGGIRRRNGNGISGVRDGRGFKSPDRTGHGNHDAEILLESAHVTVRQPRLKKRRTKAVDKSVAMEPDVRKGVEILREALWNLGLSKSAFAAARTRLEVQAEKAVGDIETLCGELKRLDLQIWSNRVEVEHAVAAVSEAADKEEVQRLQVVQLLQAVVSMCGDVPSVRRRCESLSRVWTSE